MQIIDANATLVIPYRDWQEARQTFYQVIEKAGRTCYKSENKITPESAETFVRKLVKHGHEAMLEHACFTVRFVIDRGVSHELVRHRIASFAQESTRYCNYSNAKFGNELTFIRPMYLEKGSEAYKIWESCMQSCEQGYFAMLEKGLTPQEARAVLPSSLKTEVIMTANMREWRHFLKLRALGAAGTPHPQMKEVAMQVLNVVTKELPAIFGDLEVRE